MILRFIEGYTLTRDILYVLVVASILLLLYTASVMFQRVGDSGYISSTFGLGLYLVGEAVFHFGSLINAFYDYFNNSLIGFRIINYIYLISMALFSVFTEIEQNKIDQTNLTKNENPKRFPYLNSILSIIILAIFIPLTINDGNLVTFAFLFMVFPFISSSDKSLKRLKGLKMLEESKPSTWFFVGLSLSGFSNFVNGLPINYKVAVFIQAISVILGTLMMVHAWKIIPSFNELKWFRKMDRLMVLQRTGSLVLYSYEFQSKDQETASSENVLASGAISGIQSLLSEITKSKERINVIDHGDKTLYFEHVGDFSFVLFCNGKSREYTTRLNIFANDFISKYEETLNKWKGNVSQFDDADELVKKDFLDQY